MCVLPGLMLMVLTSGEKVTFGPDVLQADLLHKTLLQLIIAPHLGGQSRKPAVRETNVILPSSSAPPVITASPPSCL